MSSGTDKFYGGRNVGPSPQKKAGFNFSGLGKFGVSLIGQVGIPLILLSFFLTHISSFICKTYFYMDVKVLGIS